MITPLLIALATIAGIGLFLVLLPMMFRVVVQTNEVHIVQTGGGRVSFGNDPSKGNSYYNWPTWVPVYGVQRTIMPLSVFDLDLKAYEAYDVGRLPFVIDVKAFFRISDSDTAAQRVANITELQNQLMGVLQGAVRKILATNDIEEIMQGRGKLSNEFTQEVTEQLKSWGVQTVKNIELMDIRDSKDSRVIHNIMSKKQSHIEMESRLEVAKNSKLSEVAEIEARREIDLQKQEAEQQVGLRTVSAQRQVELAKQEQSQQVKEQEKITMEKTMAIKLVEEKTKAEIAKDVEVIRAEQKKKTTIIGAEGDLEAEKRKAEGITVNGDAIASAEKAKLLAPVEAQITLAKEIGENENYQRYLLLTRQIEATQAIGIVQAEALKAADIKVITNTGDPTTGLNNVMDLFSSKGGLALGSMLEGIKNTETGGKLIEKVLPSSDKD